MDYKELADRLEKRYKANETGSTFVTLCSRRDVLNAATAITDLLARVRELETSFRTEKCENGPECVELGRVRKALAEAEARAEKAERERDAAVSALESIMAYNKDTCQFCKNGQCYIRGGTKPCLPKWRGQKED